MQIKDCTCPGEVREKHVSLSCAILTFCCTACGGGIASLSDYLHGIEQQVASLKADLYQQLGDVPAPGKALVTECIGCNGRGCRDCGNTGRELMKACPKCGDVGFDFINGHSEQAGMVCRLGCGFKWAADDPRWLAQRLPAASAAA
jgi:hypothetical protein